MTSNVVPAALIHGAILLACSSGAGDGQTDSDASESSGGYTGLGKYVETSGVYGNGLSHLGGAAVVASTTPNGIGGRADFSSGGAVGSVSIAGGAPASLSNLPTSGASGSPSGGQTVGGASPTSRSSTAAASTGGSTIAVTTAIAPSGGRASSGGPGVGASTSTGGRVEGGASAVGASGGALPQGSGGMSVGSGGASTTSSTFTWPGAYDPAGVPSNSTGKHNPGSNCMGSGCHASTQSSRAFAFGGTVYQSNGTTVASNVQIAIVSGSTVVTAYSATNGNFWLPLASAPSVDWTKATVHLRNSKGEVAKAPGTTLSAPCNSCHGSTMRITAP
jgi:hypothetical protein